MFPNLPPSKYLDMSHNDEMDVDGDRHERIRRRASLMAPLLEEGSGFQWLAVGHAITPLPPAARTAVLSPPASPLVRSLSPVHLPCIPSDIDVPELVPSYANSAPSEEEDFELFDEHAPYADPDFPLGDQLHSPAASMLVEKGIYKPDAALIDVEDDPFKDLRESLRVMTGIAKEQAEDELRAHEVHEDMTARLHEAMW